MVLLSPDLYEQTKQLLLGNAEKSSLLVEFAGWLHQKYAVDLLNVEFGRIDNPNNRHRLYLILNSAQDEAKLRAASFQRNFKVDLAISNHFRHLAQKHGFADQQAMEKFFCRLS